MLKSVRQRLVLKISAFVFLSLLAAVSMFYFQSEFRIKKLAIQGSKEKPWTSQIKNVVEQTCVKNTQDFKRESTDPNKKDFEHIEKAYCSCLVSKVENAHVVTTEYRGLTPHEESVQRQIEKDFKNYTSSKKAALDIEVCKASALAELNTDSASL